MVSNPIYLLYIHLYIVVVVVVVAVIVVVVVAEQKKEEKDTQNTQNKKKQRMKTDKKNCGLLAISSFISRERTLFLSYVVKNFGYHTFLSVLIHV